MKRRSNGGGSYCKLPSGNWRAKLMIGYTPDGKKKVKSFTAPTKAEAPQMVRNYIANATIEQNENARINPESSR